MKNYTKTIELDNKRASLITCFCCRPGATRELVNAMSQPTVQNLYKDLVYKIEAISNPTSPMSPVPPNEKNKSFINGNGVQKNVNPDKIG